MNKKEELKYLTALVLEASKWRVSENDDRDPIRMEVEQRLSVLTGSDEKVINGRVQSNQCPTEDKVTPYGQWCYYNRRRLKGLKEFQKRALYHNEILHPTEEDYEEAGISLDDDTAEQMGQELSQEMFECER